jgi:hypothetical protein
MRNIAWIVLCCITSVAVASPYPTRTTPAITDAQRKAAAELLDKAAKAVPRVTSSNDAALACCAVVARVQYNFIDKNVGLETYGLGDKVIPSRVPNFSDGEYIEILTMNGKANVAKGGIPPVDAAKRNVFSQRDQRTAWLTRGLADLGQYQQAVTEAAAMQAGQSDRDVALEYVMDRMRVSVGAPKSKAFSDAVTDNKLRDELTRALAASMAKARDVKGGGTLALSIKDPAIQSLALVDVSAAQVYTGDMTGAARTAKSITAKPSQQNDALSRIVTAHIYAKNLNSAVEVARMTSGHARELRLFQVASAAVELRQPKPARALLKESGMSDDIQAKALMAGILATEGDVAGAKALADGIPDQLQRSFRNSAFAAIALAQARAKDVAGAMATTELGKEEMHDVHHRASTIGQIAVISAGHGDFEGAKKLALSPKTAGYEEFALRQIAMLQLKAGDLPGAVQTVQAVSHQRGTRQGEIYREIAFTQARMKDPKAREALTKWLDSLESPIELIYANVGAAEGILGLTHESTSWPSAQGIDWGEVFGQK